MILIEPLALRAVCGQNDSPSQVPDTFQLLQETETGALSRTSLGETIEAMGFALELQDFPLCFVLLGIFAMLFQYPLLSYFYFHTNLNKESVIHSY